MSILIMDEYDDALLGYIWRPGEGHISIYSESDVIDILVKGGLSPDEAREHVDHNVNGGWMGPSTPGLLVRANRAELDELAD